MLVTIIRKKNINRKISEISLKIKYRLKINYYLLLIITIFPQFVLSGYWGSLQAIEQRLPGCCLKSEFDCGDGKCIPVSRFHDGQNDCIDGSDEFCLPGQIECGGQFCADPIHLGDCLLLISNSSCSTKNNLEGVALPVPSFCEFLNASTRRHLCHLHNTLACRGYGQCIFKKWLMDGKKDCLDGSDEDLAYVGLFNKSFSRPLLSSIPDRLLLTTTHSTTKPIVDYTSNSSSLLQLIWPHRGKVVKPIKSSSNTFVPLQQQKLRENIFATTPTYPFEKIFSSSKSTILNVWDNGSELTTSKNIQIDEKNESIVGPEKSKIIENIKIWEPKITEKQITTTESSTTTIENSERETTTTTTNKIEVASQEFENDKFQSTLENKPIDVADVDSTLESEQLTTIKTEKEKSLLWLFLLLLFLFCLCCLVIPFIWCCFSKQRRSNFFTILRRRWRNMKLKMGRKQTQPTLLPTIAATTALTTATATRIIPQESGISIISESVEESPAVGGAFSLAEHENTLKIPSIGEVGRIASLAQAWQQQHHKQSKVFDDSEDYLIMEEGEEETGGKDIDLRRQSSITTFLDKGKTFEKKDTTTTKTTTTTTITEEKKDEEDEQKEEEKKPIELQKSSTFTETSTIAETKAEEEKEGTTSISVVDASLQLPSLLSTEKIDKKNEHEEKREEDLSSCVTSRPGTPTIWAQFRVLGEQYSGADDQIALATERRDSLDDILTRMDTIEKQQIIPLIEKHEIIIEELNEQNDEEKVEEDEDKNKEEEKISILETEKDTMVDDKIELIKEETEKDKEEEIKEEIKLGSIQKSKILPKIEKEEKEGKLTTKSEEFKKHFANQKLEKQQKVPSIPPLDVKKCMKQTPLSVIKTKKELPRFDKIEKTIKENSKKEENDVFVILKGRRVITEHERKTPKLLLSMRGAKQEKTLTQQKQQKFASNEEKRREVKEHGLIGIRQRRERLHKLRAQRPILESSCDELCLEKPTFDPDLPSTSNYQNFSYSSLYSNNGQQHHRIILPQIEEQIEKKVHSGCILSGRQPWNSNPRVETSNRWLPPLISEPTSAERSPERIEAIVHSGCITDREPWDSHLKPALSPTNINPPVSSKRLKTTDNFLKTQTSIRRQPRPRPRSVRELNDPDWEEDFTETDNKNNYFTQYKRPKKATSSPDTKEENEDSETNNNFSKDLWMNNKRRTNVGKR
ncbi:hypothetical protein ACQ4LE_000227 [Meloidogyne hapla]